MDAKAYLELFGWKNGEALQKGGIKKPILVKHKKDTKGLGGDKKDADTWWELLFDGTLKNLDVTNTQSGISINTNKEKVADDMRKKTLPLYRMFVKGEGLKGTVGVVHLTKSKKIDRDDVAKQMDLVFHLTTNESKSNGSTKDIKSQKKRDQKDSADLIEEKKEKKEKLKKKDKKDKKEKKEKKEKTEKKDKKDKKDKKEKKDKTEKKDKKDKKDKTEKKDKKDKKEKKEKSKNKDKEDKKEKKSNDLKSKKRKADSDERPLKKSKLRS